MERLLDPDEPDPVMVQNPNGASEILLISDHAGRRIPRRLGTLGLGDADLERHIAWDIGIRDVTTQIADKLGATYIYQRYSRLVIDCNRKPGMVQSIAEVSDGTEVPGNRNLTAAEVRAREVELLQPYQATIERELDRRKASGRPTVIFAMHSCTPVFGNDPPRPWHIGVIAHRDWRIGEPLLELLSAEADLCFGRNKPYEVNMETDYTIPVHAEGRGLPYVEIEIRQDLIAETAGQRKWAELLSRLLPQVVERSGILKK
ncbi:MAG: N-formylglutamate amidohydrolase [Rhodospirillum sp.]|nr:N-formylglutamate amidohydrolase [Rhodospirillum sp.]